VGELIPIKNWISPTANAKKILNITDVGNNHVEVSWHREADPVLKHPNSLPIVDPLTLKDRKELRWYLEEYRSFPFGAEKWRAEQVETQMAAWGSSLFEQIFPQSSAKPSPIDLYRLAEVEGLQRCEVCISSEDTAILSIPWELVRDPDKGYLHHLFLGFYRRRTQFQALRKLGASGERPFRVLLVIARPYGQRDVKLGTVARPVLEALRPLRPRVHLEVLRPPTFDHFVKKLTVHPGYYDLVHFDGHGGTDSSGLGYLFFENARGDEDEAVSSRQLGQSLVKSKIPFFVLNACRSAEEGGTNDPYSSVASQLVSTGASGVVAMSYTVYADTASVFMRRFYESLVEDGSVVDAVSAGRRCLYEDASRRSVVGAIEVQDWIVPTLYQQGSGAAITASRVADSAENERQATLLLTAQEVCPEGEFGFIGRDDDILRIERALRDDDRPWVLLTGSGGTGKTELAYGFARWFVETGGCPGGVFATSFKGKAQFSQVIGSVFGYGTDLSRLTAEQQYEELLSRLRNQQCLIIWDNFESVAGYPAGLNSLASAEDRRSLSSLLANLKGGKSRVILTTRQAQEKWLGVDYDTVSVRGLADIDIWKLAEVILKSKNTGRCPEDFQDDPAYERLLRLLIGHPRSMEVILPLLKTASPTHIIDAIEGRSSGVGVSLEDTSMSYAFEELSGATNRYLPLIGLFSCYVKLEVLAGIDGANESFSPVPLDDYPELKDLGTGGWRPILNEAAQCGFVRDLDANHYEIDPTVSRFLHEKLRERLSTTDFEKLINGFLREYFLWLADYQGALNDNVARPLIDAELEEANLLRAQRLAEERNSFMFAGVMVESLHRYYQHLGRYQEWQGLIQSSLHRLGEQFPRPGERTVQGSGSYWEALTREKARIAMARNDLNTAERCYRQILEYHLEVSKGVGEFVADTCKCLGDIARRLRRLSEADEWYRKGLDALRETDKENATLYIGLGQVAQELGKDDEAEQWYLKALEVKTGPPQFLIFHKLESIARAKGLTERAEHWRRKADEANELLEDTSYEGRDFAARLTNKALVAERQGNLDVAEAYYRRALEIFEKLELDEEKAHVYNNLGGNLESKGRLDEAEQWYQRAGELFEKLGLGEAKTPFDNLRLLAMKGNQLDESEKWQRRVIGILERTGPSQELAQRYYWVYDLLRAQGQFENALPFLVNARRVAKQISGSSDAPEDDLSKAQDYEVSAGTARLESRFEEAVQLYQSAFEIYQSQGDYAPAIGVLGQLFAMSSESNQILEATVYLGKAATLSREHKIGPYEQILPTISVLLAQIPEDDFKAKWYSLFGGEVPPMEFLRLDSDGGLTE